MTLTCSSQNFTGVLSKWSNCLTAKQREFKYSNYEVIAHLSNPRSTPLSRRRLPDDQVAVRTYHLLNIKNELAQQHRTSSHRWNKKTFYWQYTCTLRSAFATNRIVILQSIHTEFRYNIHIHQNSLSLPWNNTTPMNAVHTFNASHKLIWHKA